MTTWTTQQLDSLGDTDEIEIAPRRAEGRLGRAKPIWIVRVDDDLYVRSYTGPDGHWYQTATHSGRATITVGGTRRSVQLTPAPEVDRRAVDGAYRAKYGRSSYVTAMASDRAAATTVRVIPEPEEDR